MFRVKDLGFMVISVDLGAKCIGIMYKFKAL